VEAGLQRRGSAIGVVIGEAGQPVSARMPAA